MSENKTESNIEKAGKYLEAAKINQENLWRRRQVEWKTSFSLWIAIAIVTAFIYVYVDWIPHNPWNWIILIAIILIYIFVTCLHYDHYKRLFISNEKDLDFINYYSKKAAWELNEKDFNKNKPPRPEWSEKKPSKDEDKEFLKERKWKMNKAPIIVTWLISFFSCVIFFLKWIIN